MNRIIKYKYELLNKTNNVIGELECIDGTVNMKASGKIKYSGSFLIKENEAKDIDYLNDRIRPVLIINDIEYKLPIFLISSPQKKYKSGVITRNIIGYDLNQILLEDCLTETLFIKSGTKYKDIITRIINSAGIIDVNLTYLDKEITRDREIEIGKCKLDLINDLLKEINYTDLFVDKFNNLCSKPYILPSLRNVEHNYISKINASIIDVDIVDEIDLFNVPNVFIGSFSNPEKNAVNVKFVNDKASNILSTVNRGRNIVKIENLKDVVDKDTALSYIKRIAYESTNVCRKIQFSTLSNAEHGFSNCIYIKDDNLKINGKYIESEWQLPLKIGSSMLHKAEKIEILI